MKTHVGEAALGGRSRDRVSELSVPIAEARLSAGQAAKLASRSGVSVVLVPQASGFRLVDVRHLLSPNTRIGRVADRSGLKVQQPSMLQVMSEAPRITKIGDTAATVALPSGMLAGFGGPVGYKACSLSDDHLYPPRYPDSDCPTGDGGKLMLKLV